MKKKQTNLSQGEVLHIAKLACLKLSPVEVKKFQKQLTDILGYIDILNKVNTSNIKPTFQVTGLTNVFRKDKVKKSLKQKQALFNSKKINKGYFKIKSIF